MKVAEELGDIVLVKIEKKKYWVHDDWYCRYITVKTPSGDYVEFPCFRWLVDDKEVVLREGKGRVISQSLQCRNTSFKKKRKTLLHPSLCPVSIVAHLPQDDKTSQVKQHRQKELDTRRKTYRKVQPTHAVFFFMFLEAEDAH